MISLKFFPLVDIKTGLCTQYHVQTVAQGMMIRIFSGNADDLPGFVIFDSMARMGYYFRISSTFNLAALLRQMGHKDPRQGPLQFEILQQS